MADTKTKSRDGKSVAKRKTTETSKAKGGNTRSLSVTLSPEQGLSR